MLVLAFWQGWAKANWRFPTLTLALALAVAFVVALPFGVEILWHYRLKIVNVYPGLSPSDLLDLNELPRVARAAATLPAIGGAAALAWRATSARGDRGTRLLLAWLGVVTLFLGAHVAALLAAKAGLDLPTIVPAFHFFFYLMAIVSIGVGLALRDLSAAAIRWLDRQRTGVADGLLDWRAAILVSGTTVLLVAAYYQSYLGRADFTEVQGRAALMNREMPADAYAWIASHTSPDDVFLCSDDQSLYVVTPAGRKVVATNRYFSSPYVDWAAREADRAEMFRRLARRDVEGFRSLAGRYQVGYVILPERAPSESWLKVAGMVSGDVPPLKADDLALTPGFGVAFRGERVAIVAVRYPPG
jgi:hypothetical protein